MRSCDTATDVDDDVAAFCHKTALPLPLSLSLSLLQAPFLTVSLSRIHSCAAFPHFTAKSS